MLAPPFGSVGAGTQIDLRIPAAKVYAYQTEQLLLRPGTIAAYSKG